MNDNCYSTSKYLTPNLRGHFIAERKKQKAMHVDLTLLSHTKQIEIENLDPKSSPE